MISIALSRWRFITCPFFRWCISPPPEHTRNVWLVRFGILGAESCCRSWDAPLRHYVTGGCGWWFQLLSFVHVFFHIQWGYPLIFHSWGRMIPCDVLVSHRPWRRYWQIVNETVWLFGTSKFDLQSPLLSCSSCCSYHPDLMEGALKNAELCDPHIGTDHGLTSLGSTARRFTLCCCSCLYSCGINCIMYDNVDAAASGF